MNLEDSITTAQYRGRDSLFPLSACRRELAP